MNIILYNAKAFFIKSFTQARINFPKFHSPFPVIQFQIDPSYVCQEGLFDCRYFLDLLKNSLPTIPKILTQRTIILVLPAEWILQISFFSNQLSLHQIEREAIFYFQENMHINIDEYEFFIDKILQISIAVKKKLLQNIYSCFNKVKIHGPFKIAAECNKNQLHENRKDNLWIKFCL